MSVGCGACIGPAPAAAEVRQQLQRVSDAAEQLESCMCLRPRQTDSLSAGCVSGMVLGSPADALASTCVCLALGMLQMPSAVL